MRVLVNGVARELDPGTTLGALLATLDLPAEGVAVAVDREVVPRSRHPQVVLRDGEAVEVIRAVGGG